MHFVTIDVAAATTTTTSVPNSQALSFPYWFDWWLSRLKKDHLFFGRTLTFWYDEDALIVSYSLVTSIQFRRTDNRNSDGEGKYRSRSPLTILWFRWTKVGKNYDSGDIRCALLSSMMSCRNSAINFFSDDGKKVRYWSALKLRSRWYIGVNAWIIEELARILMYSTAFSLVE